MTMKIYFVKFRKFLPVVVVLLLLVFAGLAIGTKEKKYPQASIVECSSDADCVCGVNNRTRECAIGNARFIDTREQCPDFCTGIEGTMTIRCIANKCSQTAVR